MDFTGLNKNSSFIIFTVASHQGLNTFRVVHLFKANGYKIKRFNSIFSLNPQRNSLKQSGSFGNSLLPFVSNRIYLVFPCNPSYQLIICGNGQLHFVNTYCELTEVLTNKDCGQIWFYIIRIWNMSRNKLPGLTHFTRLSLEIYPSFLLFEFSSGSSISITLSLH